MHLLDRAPRALISEAGFGERFIHRTGHSIGRTTHETPNMIEG
jgi:Xaa-Pro aminopeptidase